MEPEDLNMFSQGLKGFMQVIEPFFKLVWKLFKLPFIYFNELPESVKLVVFGIIVLAALFLLRYFVINYDDIYLDLID